MGLVVVLRMRVLLTPRITVNAAIVADRLRRSRHRHRLGVAGDRLGVIIGTEQLQANGSGKIGEKKLKSNRYDGGTKAAFRKAYG